MRERELKRFGFYRNDKNSLKPMQTEVDEELLLQNNHYICQAKQELYFQLLIAAVQRSKLAQKKK